MTRGRRGRPGDAFRGAGLAALVGAPVFLRDPSARRGGHLDVPGVLLGTVLLVLLLAALVAALTVRRGKPSHVRSKPSA
ncbi:hypothetical protein D0C37_04690 [Streptomyces koyangensis]|uniref:Uncharacterized protein n=1 Tax=Streptomyces koyangensis TaxID=188770 RepID=A0A385D6H7_9ACTN|nr:hypothetical protein D0C37_04690 [Streptomyces koyangensis]PKR42192.1 hypothetical protein CWE27_26970 [Streptomyces sp. EAG2]